MGYCTYDSWEFTDDLELIGEGNYSSVYAKSKTKVIIVSRCPIKKLIADGKFPKHPIFPKLREIAPHVYIGERYKTQYYGKNDFLKPAQHKLFKELKGLECNSLQYSNRVKDDCLESFKSISNKSVRQALIGALKACPDWRTATDIFSMNVGATSRGGLVLYDGFYINDNV